MSYDDRHDYRELMKKSVFDEQHPTPLDSGVDAWKILLGALVVLTVLGWAIG